VIKHFDKTKQALLKGTVANIYLDYQQPEKTLEIIRELYQTQNQWKVDFSTIEAKMKQAFNLSPHKEADERYLAIHEEALERVRKKKLKQILKLILLILSMINQSKLILEMIMKKQ